MTRRVVIEADPAPALDVEPRAVTVRNVEPMAHRSRPRKRRTEHRRQRSTRARDIERRAVRALKYAPVVTA